MDQWTTRLHLIKIIWSPYSLYIIMSKYCTYMFLLCFINHLKSISMVKFQKHVPRLWSFKSFPLTAFFGNMAVLQLHHTVFSRNPYFWFMHLRQWRQLKVARCAVAPLSQGFEILPLWGTFGHSQYIFYVFFRFFDVCLPKNWLKWRPWFMTR